MKEFTAACSSETGTRNELVLHFSLKNESEII